MKVPVVVGNDTFHAELDKVSDQQYQQLRDMLADLLVAKGVKGREAIADVFESAVTVCAQANPSDLWHHVIYRTYLEHKVGSNPNQSWVRTSGEAFEVFLERHYNPLIHQYGLRLNALISGNAKKEALSRMNLHGEIGGSKIDIIIEKRGKGVSLSDDGYGIIGGAHAKVSLAERVSDDIPASRIMMAKGFESILVTLDVKSFPPPNGDLVNRGELGSQDSPSDKRKYIEEHGDFSVCVSYNDRSKPSTRATNSGKRILVGRFNSGSDPLLKYLSSL